jgi:hypothetical protein
MSFQSYIDNIRAKTGKSPTQLRDAAKRAGVFSRDMKATTLINFLKNTFDLGRGHATAIWKVFKDRGWVAADKR